MSHDDYLWDASGEPEPDSTVARHLTVPGYIRVRLRQLMVASGGIR